MKKLTLSLIMILAAAVSFAQSQYVNPFVGTDGHGHTYPGAILPFGAIQLSPDTRLDGWDGCSAYHYSDDRIYGFSHTHLSGTGCSDYGDILVTPFVDKAPVSNEKHPLPFSHKNEKAEPGYYYVQFDNGITAEMTVSNYVGVHRYTFTKNGTHGIVVDLKHRDKTLESYVTLKANDLVGYRRSEAWNDDQYCAFSLKTSVTPTLVEFYQGDKLMNVKELKGNNCKAVLYFDEKVKEVVVKVAISAVDMDGAMNNQTEVQDFNFDKLRKQAVKIWDKELGKIEVTSKDQNCLTNFYTALYHCFTSPYLYSDLDGRYRGADQKIHRVDANRKEYTVFSLWDTYRALHPLLNIIDQKRSSDFLYTFLNLYRQSGYLPMWELSSQETWCMIGYHAVPVILDAYMKGIRDFPANEMLEAMIATANLKKLGRPEYAKYGFVPGDMENESVSKTLEYAYDDWCIAMFAQAVGNQKVYEEYIRRAQSYKNLMDMRGFMHGRMNGGFATSFDPREVNNFYTEANGWQYTTYVPHDFNTYIEMMGGPEQMYNFLERFFNSSSEMTGRHQSDITGVIGQYAHGNEPSHHAAYLFSYVGRPDMTQNLVKKIMEGLYSPTPDGLCGNEDCGQMSAWYVFSSLGFYPVCPGSNEYVIGHPMFDKAVIHLENGKTLTITKGNDKPYIQTVKMNGETMNRSFLTYKEIASGGSIVFDMGDAPSEKWGKGAGNQPVASIPQDKHIVPVPVFSTDKVSFQDQMTVQLYVPGVMQKGDKGSKQRKQAEGGAKDAVKKAPSMTVKAIPVPTNGEYTIYYTTDGSTPVPNQSARYTAPINVDRDMTVKAIAVDSKGRSSKVAEAHYVRYTRDKDITYVKKPSSQYNAGGEVGLIDNLRGKENFRIGGWQGFTADFEVVVDLRTEKPITTVGAGCLEDQRAWIFSPRAIEVYVSDNGTDYQLFGRKDIKEARAEVAHVTDYEVTGRAKARYVKIKIRNYGKLPGWHPSFGQSAWLFVDEVWVK